MAKITEMTPEQEAEMVRFRQHCIDTACAGGQRADRSRLHAALTDAYAELGKTAPKLLLFDSPAACMMAIKVLQMWDQMGPQMSDQMWAQMSDHMWDQMGAQMRAQMWDQMGPQMRDQMWAQMSDQMSDQMSGQMSGKMRAQMWDQMGDQMSDQMSGEEVWNGNCLEGSQDLYWIGMYKFAEYLGVDFGKETSRRLDIMYRIGQECEWWWPFENIVIASERPAIVKWDSERRLHCEDGPAIRYADGYSLASWHGTAIPMKWVEERDTIDPAEILQCENVEKRAAGLQCIGMKRVKETLGTLVHDSGDPSMGALWDIRIPGLPQPGRYLSAMCPRNGEIFEGVPFVSDIDGLPINTALAAQAWRIGDPQSEYQHNPVRT